MGGNSSKDKDFSKSIDSDKFASFKPQVSNTEEAKQTHCLEGRHDFMNLYCQLLSNLLFKPTIHLTDLILDRTDNSYTLSMVFTSKK